MRLKQNYLYQFSHHEKQLSEVVQITKTYPLSDSFKAQSVQSHRAWHNSFKVIKRIWNITELGHKDEYPEYYL